MPLHLPEHRTEARCAHARLTAHLTPARRALTVHARDLRSPQAPTYAKFLKKYRAMLANAASLLRPGHCFAIVIGNLREKSGELLDLHGDTKQALAAAGCQLYNGACPPSMISYCPPC